MITAGPYFVLSFNGDSLAGHVDVATAETFTEAWALRDDQLRRGRGVLVTRAVETRVVEVEQRHAPVVGGVRGERLRELIEQVAAETMTDGEPVHYRVIMARVEARGVQVGGKNPSATFLTHLTRVPSIESVGKRSGLYRLRGGA